MSPIPECWRHWNAEPEWTHPPSKVIYTEGSDVLGETGKLANLMKNKGFYKKNSFSLSSVREDLNYFTLTPWNSSSSLQYIKSLFCQQNLCRLERQKHSQHSLKNGIFTWPLSFAAVNLFLLFEEHKIKEWSRCITGRTWRSINVMQW